MTLCCKIGVWIWIVIVFPRIHGFVAYSLCTSAVYLIVISFVIMLEWIVVCCDALGITPVWWLIIVAWHHRWMSRQILEVKVLTTTVYLKFWIFKRFHRFILASNHFLMLLACEWRVTWSQGLVSHCFDSSVRVSFLHTSGKVKGVSFSTQTATIPSIAVRTAAISNRKILIAFVKCILSYFSLDT